MRRATSLILSCVCVPALGLACGGAGPRDDADTQATFSGIQDADASEDDSGPGSSSGDVDGTSADSGSADSGSAESSSGSDSADTDAMSCPASGTVTLSAWTDAPWVAPQSGDAQQEFRLSEESWLHYRRFELDMDMDVTEVLTTYQLFLELRNTGGPKNESYPWRYLNLITKNESPEQFAYVVYATSNEGYKTENFTLEPDTTYHVNVVFDAAADLATATMTKLGGAPVTVMHTSLTSSIVPQGQGLDLWVGLRTSHPDYPTIKPPWGWSFYNLEVTLEPGGPYGELAPMCP